MIILLKRSVLLFLGALLMLPACDVKTQDECAGLDPYCLSTTACCWKGAYVFLSRKPNSSQGWMCPFPPTAGYNCKVTVILSCWDVNTSAFEHLSTYDLTQADIISWGSNPALDISVPKKAHFKMQIEVRATSPDMCCMSCNCGYPNNDTPVWKWEATYPENSSDITNYYAVFPENPKTCEPE